MNPIRFLSRFFGILVLAILAIGGAIASHLYLSGKEPDALRLSGNESNAFSIIAAVPEIFLLILYICLIWIIARFTASLLASIMRYTLEKKTDSSIVLASAVITSFMSWEEATYLFNRLGIALSDIINGSIPLIANTVNRLSYSRCEYELDASYCLRRNLYDSLNGMLDVFMRPAATFFGSVFQNPQPLLIVLINFAIVYLLLSFLFGRQIILGLQTILNSERYSTAHLKNALLFLLIIFAGYLSLGSVVVLPIFTEEEPPKEVAPEVLAQRLQIMVITDADIQKYREEFDAKGDFPEEYSQLIAEGTKDPIGISQADDTSVGVFRAELERTRENYLDKVKYMDEILDENTKRFLDAQSRRTTWSMNEYEQMYSLPYGSRDKRRYFSTLTKWFQYINGKELNDLEGCFEDVARYVDYLRQRKIRYLRAYREMIDRGGRSKDLGRELSEIQRYWEEPVEEQVRIRSSCRTRSVDAPPEQPVIGALSLGIVGSASVWLLRTGSVAFTTVMGMLGFGLLGATFSTFIREQRRRGRPASGALVEDLAGAVIRGMSAALVVFLGVYGGLAVVAGGGQPNPYVMFFLCLVGAVFSESVWGWARRKLDEQLTAAGEGGKNGKKSKIAGSATAADTKPAAATPAPTPQRRQKGREVEHPSEKGTVTDRGT